MKKVKKVTFKRFALGGAPGAILGYVILFLYTPKNQEISSLILISVIAFFVKESVSFITHKWWTFQKLSLGKIVKEILSYFSVMIFLTVLNTVLFYGLVETWKLNSVLTQAIINSFSMFVGYVNAKEVFE